MHAKFAPTMLSISMLCVAALAALLRYDSGPAGSLPASEFLMASAQDDPSALRCSNRNSTGVGLKGEYFAQRAIRGELLLSRIDSTVEFGQSLDWPADRAAGRPQSARWRGWIKAPLSGHYRFHGEPSARIKVGGLPMAGPAASPDASLEMVAGSLYPIVMEIDSFDAQRVSLEWTAPHGVRYVIPRALLFLPTSG
jgi:hypothetical protein